jgi:hypothetical protein
MDNCCQFADECPVFEFLNDPSRKVVHEMFCLGEFGRCQRRQLLMAGGQAPPDMLPTGNLLSRATEQPKTLF